MSNNHSPAGAAPYLSDTLALILAGGAGTRLQTLTRWQAKPAVSFGGKYRTIDFSLSNCVNSSIRKICILTQYKSQTLNTHISRAWNIFHPGLGEFIELVPAQQRVKESWYSGTADSVFQNLDIIRQHNPKYVLVLAGDHIYKMNYAEMLQHHIEVAADMTVGSIEVPLAHASECGIMTVDNQHWITAFTEKPAHPPELPDRPGYALASMGIYIFTLEFLMEELVNDSRKDSSSHDFGKDIIPCNILDHKVSAYPFRDPETSAPAYWRDVGTIDAYYQANIELLNVSPQLNLYDKQWPIWTYQRQLPPAKFVFDDDGRRGMAVDSMVSAGCIVSGSTIKHSVLSNNVRIHSYSTIDDSVILPDADVGRNCQIKRAIVGEGCRLPPKTVIGENREEDEKRFYVSDNGIVLVTQDMLEPVLTDVA